MSIIIKADDFGRDKYTSNNIISCYKKGSITSASAMVFMNDSKRSAEIAQEEKLDVGLHLNFTEKYTGEIASEILLKYHLKIAKFLSMNKYALVLYNPTLTKCFDYVFKSQYDEFFKIYNKPPSHIDGHQHMHLCTNMILHKIIPIGSKVRRSFSFTKSEKSIINVLYRIIVDKLLSRRYISTDFFFDISPLSDVIRLQNIIDLAKTANVELMVHPGRQDEYNYLINSNFFEVIESIKKISYSDI